MNNEDRMNGIYRKIELLRKEKIRRKTVTVKLCSLILLIVISASTIGFYTYSEAKEYKIAKQYMVDLGIDIEGLTKEELKLVYEDIMSDAFKEDETLEVLKKTAQKLGIEEIPDDARIIFYKYNYYMYLQNIEKGYTTDKLPKDCYVFTFSSDYDNTFKYRYPTMRFMKKDKVIWEKEYRQLKNIGFSNAYMSGDYIYVWGKYKKIEHITDNSSRAYTAGSVICKMSLEGEIIWTKGDELYRIDDILTDSENNVVCFLTEESNQTNHIMRVYSESGELIEETEKDFSVIRLYTIKDGYYALAYKNQEKYIQYILKLDSSFNTVYELDLSLLDLPENFNVAYNDMLVINNRFYLSCSLTHKQDKVQDFNEFLKNSLEKSKAALEKAGELNHAALIVVDFEGNIVKYIKHYGPYGALAYDLEVNDNGQILQYICKYDDYTLFLESNITNYYIPVETKYTVTYDLNGNVIKVTKTSG